MKRNPIIVSALVAGLVAGISMWVILNFSYLLAWATFIGWASYSYSRDYHKAFFTNSICMVFGVLMAWLVAFIVAKGWFPIGPSHATAIASGIALFIIVCASGIMLLSNVPATFCGFAATFAYLAINSNILLTECCFHNPVVVVSISLLIGGLLGAIHHFITEWFTRYHKFTYYEGEKDHNHHF